MAASVVPIPIRPAPSARGAERLFAPGGAGDASNTSHAQQAAAGTKDKQFRVDSDVKCAAVCGHSVWMGHNDGTVTIRRTRSAEVVRHFVAGAGARVWSMTLVQTDSGSFMWLGLSNGDIEVHAADQSDAIAFQRGLLSESQDGKKTASSSFDSQHSTATSSCTYRLQRHTGGVYCLTEFNNLVYSGSSDFEIIQWDGKNCTFLRQFTGHSNYVRALHAEGAMLLSASDDHTIRIWNALSGVPLSVARFHKHGVSTLCRAGVSVWSGDDNGNIIVWKLQTLEVEDTLNQHVGRIAAIKKIGARVYTGAADHNIIIWDAFTRQMVTKIADHRGWILGLACPSQLCRYYVWSMAADSTVRCWHHDEYRVMTSDYERFDDAKWFHTESTPFKELNQSLIDRLSGLEGRYNFLQHENYKNATTSKGVTDELASARTEIGQLKEKVAALQLELENSQKMSSGRLESILHKEKELGEISGRLKSATSEIVDLKCKNESLVQDATELRRKLELAEAERTSYKEALDRALDLKKVGPAGASGPSAGDIAAGIGVRPLILTNPSEATAAVEKLSTELNTAIALNVNMKEELEKYRRIMDTLQGKDPNGLGHATPRSQRRGIGSPTARRGPSPPMMSVHVQGKTSTTTLLPESKAEVRMETPTAGSGYGSLGSSWGPAGGGTMTNWAGKREGSPTGHWMNDPATAYVTDRYYSKKGPSATKPAYPSSARSTGRRGY